LHDRVGTAGVVAAALLMSVCGGGQGDAPIPYVMASEEAEPTPDPSATPLPTLRRPIAKAAFGPWYGSGCPDNGGCGCGGATTLDQEFQCQIGKLREYDIPITTYLFDGTAWSFGDSSGTSQCSGPNCCRWKLGDPALATLRSNQVRAQLHFWGGCHTTEQYQRAYGLLGNTLLGFYLDDGSSDTELEGAAGFMGAVLPGNSEVTAKAYQNRQPSTSNSGLTQFANTCYIGDLSYDFAGLRTGVDRVLAKARYLPAPFAEFTGYAFLDDGAPTEEVYFRRLHFGALQPVMAHTPYANCDPWSPPYSEALLDAYQYYAWLHKELVPYFYSTAFAMYENPSQYVLRKQSSPSSYLIGSLIFVSIVTEAVQQVAFTLPSGYWVNYWDEASYSGAVSGYRVPLGREPILIKDGALIPLDVERNYCGHGDRESAGSLTVLVYPRDTTTFRYRQQATDSWITFRSQLSGTQLTLSTSPTRPTQAVLYRVARWTQEPSSVKLNGQYLRINQGSSAGTVIARATREAEVNAGTGNGWYFDALARRLIIKVFP
jgi:hypothetical protein